MAGFMSDFRYASFAARLARTRCVWVQPIESNVVAVGMLLCFCPGSIDGFSQWLTLVKFADRFRIAGASAFVRAKPLVRLPRLKWEPFIANAAVMPIGQFAIRVFLAPAGFALAGAVFLVDMSARHVRLAFNAFQHKDNSISYAHYTKKVGLLQRD